MTPADHRAIWDAEDEAFRDHWGGACPHRPRVRGHVRPVRAGHRPLGGRLGRRPGRRRRPDLDLDRGERATRRRARLAREDQRPATVAEARPRTGHDGRRPGQAPRRRHDRGDARAWTPRTRPGRSACTNGSGSRCTSGRSRTSAEFDPSLTAPVEASLGRDRRGPSVRSTAPARIPNDARQDLDRARRRSGRARRGRRRRWRCSGGPTGSSPRRPS